MAANNIPPEPIPISQSPVPLSQIDRAPAPVPTDTTATPTIPLAWILEAPQPVSIANIAEPGTLGPAAVYAIAVYANGVLLTSQAQSLNFVGPAVVSTVDRNNVTVTITGGNGAPGGNNQQVQFNNSGVFGGVTGFTFNSSSNVLNIPGNLIATGNITGNYLFGNGSQLTGLPSNYGNANVATFLGAFGSNTINTTGTITGGNFVQSGVGNVNGYNAYFANNITAQGTLQATGLIIPAGSGTFYGNTTTGVGALFAGLPGYTELGSNVVAQFAANVDSYAQINLQNLSTGELASADYIITGDIGNNSTYYADFGLASSTHQDPYFFGDVGTSNDGYLFIAGNDAAGPSTNAGPGNLILGSTNGLIKMFVGNTAQANVIATISSTGLSVVGNVTGNVVSANTFAIAGGTELGQIEGANTVGFYNASANTQFLIELGGSNAWSFNGNTGGTGFPILSVQRGDNPSGTISGQTLLFDNASQEAIISTPNGNPTDGINSQRLVINPGEGYDSGEGGDIYLWAGRGGNASGSGGDIKIRGGQGGANTVGGVGGDGGYIRMEAGDTAATGGNPGYVQIAGGVSSTAQGGYASITGGEGATLGGSANITGGYGFTAGGTVNLLGGYGGQGPGGNVSITGGGSGNGLAEYGNVSITAGTSTWRFDNVGTLTLSYGAVIKDTPGNSVAFGLNAGANTQGNSTVAIGDHAGANTQSIGAVAIGLEAGIDTQGANAVAIGSSAGGNAQGIQSVAIGTLAGNTSQGNSAVAVGTGAGNDTQGSSAVAIGARSAQLLQGIYAVAIGADTGETSQGASAVAVGTGAGNDTQGIYAVAIGASAGESNQGNNSIIINATGATLDQTTANTFTVAPVRNDVANTAEVMFYNATSKEITYGNTVSVSGNITGGNIVTAGSGGNITLTGGDILGVNIVVTTPTALANLTAVAGGRAFVNNANLVAAGNFGNQVGSGGSNTVPVWSDGTNWYIG